MLRDHHCKMQTLFRSMWMRASTRPILRLLCRVVSIYKGQYKPLGFLKTSYGEMASTGNLLCSFSLQECSNHSNYLQCSAAHGFINKRHNPFLCVDVFSRLGKGWTLTPSKVDIRPFLTQSRPFISQNAYFAKDNFLNRVNNINPKYPCWTFCSCHMIDVAKCGKCQMKWKRIGMCPTSSDVR